MDPRTVSSLCSQVLFARAMSSPQPPTRRDLHFLQSPLEGRVPSDSASSGEQAARHFLASKGCTDKITDAMLLMGEETHTVEFWDGERNGHAPLCLAALALFCQSAAAAPRS